MPFQIAWKKRYLEKSIHEFSYWLKATINNEFRWQINTLFHLMNKVEPMINLTPALLARLKALQGLHTESATFSRSIKMISEEQSKIAEELDNLSGVGSQVSS